MAAVAIGALVVALLYVGFRWNAERGINETLTKQVAELKRRLARTR